MDKSNDPMCFIPTLYNESDVLQHWTLDLRKNSLVASRFLEDVGKKVALEKYWISSASDEVDNHGILHMKQMAMLCLLVHSSRIVIVPFDLHRELRCKGIFFEKWELIYECGREQLAKALQRVEGSAALRLVGIWEACLEEEEYEVVHGVRRLIRDNDGNRLKRQSQKVWIAYVLDDSVAAEVEAFRNRALGLIGENLTRKIVEFLEEDWAVPPSVIGDFALSGKRIKELSNVYLTKEDVRLISPAEELDGENHGGRRGRKFPFPEEFNPLDAPSLIGLAIAVAFDTRWEIGKLWFRKDSKTGEDVVVAVEMANTNIFRPDSVNVPKVEKSLF